MERRTHARRKLLFPMRIGTSLPKVRRLGVTRDVSETGVLFGSYLPLAVGEKVTLAWRASRRDSAETRVQGTVIRVDSAAHSVFPYMIAVMFDVPLRAVPFAA